MSNASPNKSTLKKKFLAGAVAASLLGVGAAVPAVAGQVTDNATSNAASVNSVRDAEALTLENGVIKVGKKYRWTKKCYTNDAEVKKCRWVKVSALRWKPKPTATTTATPTVSPTATSSETPTTTSTTASPSPTATATTSPSPTATTTTLPAGWQPSVAPSGDSTHNSFIATGPDGKPVRWNPCAMPITWRYNGSAAPTNGLELTQEAINRVAAATGFTFKYLGTTTAMPYTSTYTAPSDTRFVIAWATPTQVTDLGGNVVGLGGPQYAWNSTGQAKITHATVAIDGTEVAPSGYLKAGFQSGTSVGTVLMHEIGHAMGLGHYSDVIQVMNPGVTSTSNTWFMNGDLGGLSKIDARQTCTW